MQIQIGELCYLKTRNMTISVLAEQFLLQFVSKFRLSTHHILKAKYLSREES